MDAGVSSMESDPLSLSSSEDEDNEAFTRDLDAEMSDLLSQLQAPSQNAAKSLAAPLPPPKLAQPLPQRKKFALLVPPKKLPHVGVKAKVHTLPLPKTEGAAQDISEPEETDVASPSGGPDSKLEPESEEPRPPGQEVEKKTLPRVPPLKSTLDKSPVLFPRPPKLGGLPESKSKVPLKPTLKDRFPVPVSLRMPLKAKAEPRPDSAASSRHVELSPSLAPPSREATIPKKSLVSKQLGTGGAKTDASGSSQPPQRLFPRPHVPQPFGVSPPGSSQQASPEETGESVAGEDAGDAEQQSPVSGFAFRGEASDGGRDARSDSAPSPRIEAARRADSEGPGARGAVEKLGNANQDGETAEREEIHTQKREGGRPKLRQIDIEDDCKQFAAHLLLDEAEADAEPTLTAEGFGDINGEIWLDEVLDSESDNDLDPLDHRWGMLISDPRWALQRTQPRYQYTPVVEPAYVASCPTGCSVGVRAPPYRSLYRRPKNYVVGVSYLRHYELPTVSRLLKAPAPEFLRKRPWGRTARNFRDLPLEGGLHFEVDFCGRKDSEAEEPKKGAREV
ncbi:conserved hypothetical protein [Neospora caninum Liverpool]|uniref:Uncharacterized protein n=1 Tax=Neospora caninum (strain Liverpool) TaxID=572307 RepID=F0VFS5_NEOCL|nr:conserved hypothetical protein [Neospora caninum Liverpool]CBZ52569.1 conserved hypothetical protein [Neospora caninum Liverpool]CEL66545.1 TPA: hypothetical protein BN1204_023570 [Neospora caninum Liverpool]|eukprot:XP_003882601.1 conserved hypothetical protein [Neospora caninum Liverpool]